MLYPEYVKARADDEISLESSDEEDSNEKDAAAEDPDYRPTFWEADDDYVPKQKKRKKASDSAWAGPVVQGGESLFLKAI